MSRRFEDYGGIFEKRGHLYHRAMAACPRARDDEFAHTVEWASLRDGQIVYDVPSGAGYLRRHVGARVTLIHVETSKVFAHLCRADGDQPVVLGTLDAVPLHTRSADRVISLAALHHVEDKPRVFRELGRLLRPHGLLCIVDARRGSPVAEFLNGFVHEHNSMGHEGSFIDDDTTADLVAAGFEVERAADVAFPWRFRSPEEMVSFVQPLFGVDRATPDQVRRGIEHHLGWQNHGDECWMHWELRFVRAVKLSA